MPGGHERARVTRTYYDVLGVARDADAERVRAAYRERVKEVHPDVSDRPDAAERFRTLSAARDVLCDPDERARYDQLGHEAYVGESIGPHGDSTAPSPGGEDDPEPDDDDAAAADEADASGETARAGTANGESGGTDWRNQRRRNRRHADAWASGRGAGPQDGGHRWDAADAKAAAGDASAAADASAKNASRTGYVGSDEASWYRTGAGDATGYSVSTRTDSAVRFTAERGLLAVAVFICYPMLLGVAVLPLFGTLVRVAAAVCALLVVAQTLSIPESGVLVFGALTLTAPVGLHLAGVGVLSPEAVLAWAFCWIPFVIAVGNFLALRG